MRVNLLPSNAPEDRKLAQLHGVSVFAELPARRLRRLAGLLDQLDVPAGDVLVAQGELPREFLVVVDGNASVERDGEVVGNIGPGAFIGEMALLDRRTRRNATVRALTDMQVLVGDARVLDAVLDVDPDVRQAVETTASHRAARNAA